MCIRDSTSTFRDAILAAVNLGDDADTTAAVCGQVAGAFYGQAGDVYKRQGYKYPIRNGIPVMLIEEGKKYRDPDFVPTA